MESWAVYYLGAVIMWTGAYTAQSNGGTLVLFIISSITFVISASLKLVG